MRGHRQTSCLLALMGLAAVSGCSSPTSAPNNPAGVLISSVGSSPEGGAMAFHGITLDQPYAEPAETFTDMLGDPFTFAADAKRPVVLVFFGYTHCPDVCSTVLADVAAALRPLDPGTRKKVELVFITTDPARDTGPVMRDYLARFDPTFVGITASMDEVIRVAAGLGVAVTGRETSAESYTVGHGAQVLGFGPDRTASVVWLPGTPVKDLRSDVVRLASAA